MYESLPRGGLTPPVVLVLCQGVNLRGARSAGAAALGGGKPLQASMGWCCCVGAGQPALRCWPWCCVQEPTQGGLTPPVVLVLCLGVNLRGTKSAGAAALGGVDLYIYKINGFRKRLPYMAEPATTESGRSGLLWVSTRGCRQSDASLTYKLT